MNKSTSIKKNFFLSTLYEILCIITPFISAPYLSRVLGAEQIGVNSFVYSIQSYFCMVATLGTASYGGREISRVRDSLCERSKTFWEIEILSIFTSTIAIAGWIIFICLTSEYKIYYTILTLGLFNSMFDISWFYKGIEQFKYTVMRNTVVKIIEIICIFSFVKKRDDLIIFILLNSSCSLIGTLSMWLPLRKMVTKIPVKELKIFKHLRETLIYFIPAIATSIYTVLDKTLIGIITHEKDQNGYYEQAEKVIKIIKTFSFGSLSSVLGVRSSYLYAKEKYDDIKILINKSIDYLSLISIGCCFGLLGCANRFVPLFFGAGYNEVVRLIWILSPIVVIIGVSNTLGANYYTPSGKRLMSAKFLIIGAVVNLIFNLIFIPKYKSYGAAAGSILAETIITLLYIKFCDGYFSLKFLLKTIWKKVFAGLLVLGYLILINKIIKNDILCLSIQFFGGAAIYFVTLVLLKDNFLVNFLIPKILAMVKSKLK